MAKPPAALLSPQGRAAFDHAGARPVGVVDQDMAVIDHFADNGDMAHRHRAGGTERQHRTGTRGVANVLVHDTMGSPSARFQPVLRSTSCATDALAAFENHQPCANMKSRLTCEP